MSPAAADVARKRPLARYTDAEGRPREVVAVPGAHGSVLVLDRDAATLCDRRLVAHLAPDEPPENAALVCRLYLQDARGRRCRPVAPSDLLLAPPAEGHAEWMSPERPMPDAPVERVAPPAEGHAEWMSPERPAPDAPVERHAERHRERPASEARLLRCEGRLYRIAPVAGRRGAIAQLRWSRTAPGCEEQWQPVSLREVIERFESYRPRAVTARALARHPHPPRVSTTILRGELQRLHHSPIVLNRGLREAVQHAVSERGLTLSEIAMRCGKVKRDRRGRPSGETSWLARRVGLLPEGGERLAARWIHSDVLALIARRGLGVSPREVELG